MNLFNSLTKSLEEFKPMRGGEVRMYHCGPTVYDYVHIGNMRSYLFADTLRRSFEYSGYKVKQVINITDLGHLVSDADEGDDKMTKGLRREGKPITLEAMKELADFYTKKFFEDLKTLNILPAENYPKASEHIEAQIKLIETLREKGIAYELSDGIYFDTSKDKEYGKLGGLTDIATAETRLENREKINPRDFVLWKFNEKMGFPSPWGQGFPGWHIECSAMSMLYLGETFDIHTGGRDLAPIHHNNEIAQSEGATGHPLAHYWLHNEFINLSGAKMSKSGGSGITLKDLIYKGFSPLSYRYFLLLSHYRSQAVFSWESLQAAENAYRKMKEFVEKITKSRDVNEEYKNKFKEALENDLNTPEALSIVWQLIKDNSLSPPDKKATLLDFDKVLGLNLSHNEFEIGEIPKEIQSLINEREKARQEKDFNKSDELRKEIENKGYIVKDTPDGQKISKA